jgi:ribosomal protein L11 methyltransferase
VSAMDAWPALDLTFPPAESTPAPTLRDLVLVLLHDLEPVAIHEEIHDADSWRVYFRSAESRRSAGEALRSAWTDSGLALAEVDVAAEDWAARSQAELRRVRVGSIVVAPPWDLPASLSPLDIVIRPSMGFGTGHHATTRLCLQALQWVGVSGRTVIDVGTGSGVLAIAAHRLGASRTLAIDTDPDALSCAAENVALNEVAAAIELHLSDFRTMVLPTADVLVANLTGALLAQEARLLTALLKEGGRLVLGGLTIAEEPRVVEAFVPPLVTVWRQEEEGWTGLVLDRPRGTGDETT